MSVLLRGGWLAALLAVTAAMAQTPAPKPIAATHESQTRALADFGTAAGRRHAEDVIAAQFEEIRQQAKLRPLSRINGRARLQQLVCSAAATGKPVPLDTAATSALFETAKLASTHTDLRHAALFDDTKSRDSGLVSRFAVAAWPSKTLSASGQPQFWVGVALYLGPIHEWIDEHLTTRRKTREELQFSIVPACREVQ